ncbi:hypothetical protein KKE60_06055 [Patescibacteria group bacterium]|nr:hypothetical protein [Patescibacteria group bacterium]
MKYKLTVEATEQNNVDDDMTEESFVTLYFPRMEGHFTVNALVSNALSSLVPLLVGDALGKIEDYKLQREERE